MTIDLLTGQWAPPDGEHAWYIGLWTHTHPHAPGWGREEKARAEAVTWIRGCQHQICLIPPRWPTGTQPWINGCVQMGKTGGGEIAWKRRVEGVRGMEERRACMLLHATDFKTAQKKQMWVCTSMEHCLCVLSPSFHILAVGCEVVPSTCTHTQTFKTGLSKAAETFSD